ncbi:DNA cytosine methyltransferase, partial [uncultured Phocaeicola sp.]
MKQIHIRLEDRLYQDLMNYSKSVDIPVQDVARAIIAGFFSEQNREKSGKSNYSFIDLFAGIGGMRIAFEQNGCTCLYSN